MKALGNSIKSLDKPIILLVLILMIYGGLLVQILKGKLEYRCRYTDTPFAESVTWPVVSDTEYLCGNKSCPAGTYCRSSYDYNLPFE